MTKHDHFANHFLPMNPESGSKRGVHQYTYTAEEGINDQSPFLQEFKDAALAQGLKVRIEHPYTRGLHVTLTGVAEQLEAFEADLKEARTFRL